MLVIARMAGVSAAAMALLAGAAAPAAPTGYLGPDGWGGYVAYGGTYRSISAQWTIPTVTCTSTTNLFAAWVGVDGYTSAPVHTVEQEGFDVSCATGTPVYKAWYEMAPAAPVHWTDAVKPGDTFWASTSVKAGAYTLTVADRTRGWTETTTQTCATCPNNSAEVVLESPPRSYPNFGRVTFTNAIVDGRPLAGYQPDSINSTNSIGQAETQNSPITGGRFTVRYTRP